MALTDYILLDTSGAQPEAPADFAILSLTRESIKVLKEDLVTAWTRSVVFETSSEAEGVGVTYNTGEYRKLYGELITWKQTWRKITIYLTGILSRNGDGDGEVECKVIFTPLGDTSEGNKTPGKTVSISEVAATSVGSAEYTLETLEYDFAQDTLGVLSIWCRTSLNSVLSSTPAFTYSSVSYDPTTENGDKPQYYVATWSPECILKLADNTTASVPADTAVFNYVIEVTDNSGDLGTVYAPSRRVLTENGKTWIVSRSNMDFGGFTEYDVNLYQTPGLYPTTIAFVPVNKENISSAIVPESDISPESFLTQKEGHALADSVSQLQRQVGPVVVGACNRKLVGSIYNNTGDELGTYPVIGRSFSATKWRFTALVSYMGWRGKISTGRDEDQNYPVEVVVSLYDHTLTFQDSITFTEEIPTSSIETVGYSDDLSNHFVRDFTLGVLLRGEFDAPPSPLTPHLIQITYTEQEYRPGDNLMAVVYFTVEEVV